jgi:hypothetical protein
VHYYWSHYWPIVPATDNDDDDDGWWCVWSSGWNAFQGKPKCWEKTYPSAALSTVNPRWPDPGSNPDRRSRKPVTNRLPTLSSYAFNPAWSRLTLQSVSSIRGSNEETRRLACIIDPVQVCCVGWCIIRILCSASFVACGVSGVHSISETGSVSAMRCKGRNSPTQLVRWSRLVVMGPAKQDRFPLYAWWQKQIQFPKHCEYKNRIKYKCRI